jgi:hypothetical protein
LNTWVPKKFLDHGWTLLLGRIQPVLDNLMWRSVSDILVHA